MSSQVYQCLTDSLAQDMLDHLLAPAAGSPRSTAGQAGRARQSC